MNHYLQLNGVHGLIPLVRRQTMLLLSLFVMSLGVALCVRSNMGSSVISSAPLAFTLAGEQGLVPPWSLGAYTNLLNVVLVICQILVLRRQYAPVRLLQLVIGVVFGALIDLSMWLTSSLECNELWIQAATQLAGCTVLGFGVAMEVRCGSVTMPGEGLPVVVSMVSRLSFAQAKILTDIGLVVVAIVSCLIFFGCWQWNIVGPGTLFAMLYVGIAVRVSGRCLDRFELLSGKA